MNLYEQPCSAMYINNNTSGFVNAVYKEKNVMCISQKGSKGMCKIHSQKQGLKALSQRLQV